MEQFKKFLVTVLFLFSFFFFLQQNQTCSQSRQPKISRHFVFFFVFCFFFLLSIFGKLDRFQSGRSKISRQYFVFFSFSFSHLTLYSYLAHDSSKKWQEILNQLGLISQIVQLQNFLSLLCFLFNKWKDKRPIIMHRIFNIFICNNRPFYWPLAQEKGFSEGYIINSIYANLIFFLVKGYLLCLCFKFTLFCLYSQWNGTISRVHTSFFPWRNSPRCVENFSSLFCFFFLFLFSLAKSKPVPREDSRKFLVTILFLFLFLFFFFIKKYYFTLLLSAPVPR